MYCARLAAAAALCACEAAYLASIPVKPFAGIVSVAGVSGGGGEPLFAFVVDVDAVLSNLFTPAGFGMLKLLEPCGGAAPSGGG